MRKLTLAIIFLTNTFWLTTNGQQHFYKHFTSENGLPGNKVYRVFPDSKGYIWFATENGICRYDGYEFTYYKEKDGFPDYGAYHIEESADGKIWFVPFNGKACYFQDGKIHLPDTSLGLHKYEITWITRDGENLLFGTRNFHLLMLTKNQSIKIYRTDSFFNAPIVHSYKINDSLLCFYTYNHTRVMNLKTGLIKSIDLLKNNAHEIHYTSVIKLKSGTLLIKTTSGIFRLETNGTAKQIISHKSPEFDQSIILLLEDKDGNIWLSKNKKLHLCDPNKFKPKRNFREVLNPVYASCDFEGGYWVCSNEGVFYFSSKNGSTFTTQSGMSYNSVYKIIKLQNAPPYILLEDGCLGEIKKNRFVPKYCFDINSGYALPTIINSVKNYTDLQWQNYTLRISDKGIKKINPDIQLTYHDYKNNTIMITRDSSYVFINGKKTDRIATNRLHYSRSFHFIDRENNVWISTKYGPYTYNHLTRKLIALKDIFPELNQEIISIHSYKNGVLCASKSNGLYYLSKGTLTHFSSKNGLSSNVLNDLYIEEDNNILIATPEGVNRITLSEKNTITNITYYNTSNILPSNNATCLSKHEKTIYVGTKVGLTTFADNLAPAPIPPPKIQITHLVANGKDTSIKKTNHFSYEVNNIEIKYRGISYRSDKKIVYKYKLIPIDNDWLITDQPALRYSHLSPNNYQFMVSACNADNIWCPIPAIIEFSIIPAFWQRTTFKVVVSLFLLLLILLAFLAKVKQERKKANQQKRILKADMKALQAQMNPHFIFNSLNSIQDFVLDHKPEEANFYLARFATLMRSIIDYSSKESITLQQELDFLALYLELEKIRFSEDVQFVIENNVNNADSIRIPPMMIQPLIENAIKHGINPNTNHAIIKIQITTEVALLKFEIEDNGRGMASRNIVKNNHGHESVGLKNIIERIELLGNKTKGGITIEDLLADNGEPIGTKVSLYIPILNYTDD